MQGVPPAPKAVASLQACPRPWLIGVLHVPALPGAPAARLPMDEITRRVVEDAQLLQTHGFSAVLVENFHDSPFPAGPSAPETIAAMTVVTQAVREAVSLPVGVQLLRNDALAGLGVAAATGASFVRVNVLSGAAVTDQGLVQGQADVLLRKRAALGLDDVALLADVDVKHATSLDRRPLTERARDLAGRNGADAVLVTGSATGASVDLDELERVARAVAPVPTLAASGTTAETLPAVLERCAGTLVGSALEDPTTGRIDPERASAYASSRSP